MQTKLSNLSSAALAHPMKSRTPTSSARWNPTDLPVHLSPQHSLLMRDAFIAFCSQSSKANYLFMGRNQFLQMCRTTMLATPALDVVKLGLIFDKVGAGTIGGNGRRPEVEEYLLSCRHFHCY
jgi:hypothetical protein